MLEGSYRAYGYAKGWLQKDEYVSFSEQAYGLGVIDYCNANPNNDLCYGSGPSMNSTEDGEPEMLYYFGESVQKVLPEAACPYYQDRDNQFICPDREAKLAKNPLSFKVKSIETAYSISGIKELLIKHQTALTWSDSIFSQTYMIPCDSKEGLSESVVCKHCLYPISSNVQPNADGTYDPSQCYALYITDSSDNEGHLSLHGKPFLAGGHGLLLVGYNDNYRINTGSQNDLNARTVGGFIVKNSWGPENGHSLKYWSNEISIMEENLLCPAERSAKTWLPIDTMCITNNTLEITNTVQFCSDNAAELYKRVRDKWFRGATYLKCNTFKDEDAPIFYGFTECDPDKYYVIAGAPQLSYENAMISGTWIENSPSNDGSFKIHLFEFDPKTPDALPTHKITGITTWANLDVLFTPVTIVGNDPEQCGYYFYPYQYFQEATTRMPAFGHDALGSVTYYDIEWAPSSYLFNKDSYPKFDYQYLEKSTKQMKVYNFTGPIDFTEVYPPSNDQ